MLLEVQALVASVVGNSPKRLTVGLEQNRLSMLLAVLVRHGGVNVTDQDVFVNAVGGVKVNEPGSDLAVLLAIVSSIKECPIPKKLMAFGEVGLSGEVRPVNNGQERLKEAAKLGFTSALIPKGNMPKKNITGINPIPIDRFVDAIDYIK